MRSIHQMTPPHSDHEVAHFPPTKLSAWLCRRSEQKAHSGGLRESARTCVSDLGSPTLYELRDLGHMESAQMEVM